MGPVTTSGWYETPEGWLHISMTVSAQGYPTLYLDGKRFTGRVSRLSCHKGVLSPKQIHDMYEAGKPRGIQW